MDVTQTPSASPEPNENLSQGLPEGEAPETGGSAQYLTFILADEEYGVDILQVQCIQGWDKATPIPNTPSYVLGVINLRGAIVPIIELRRRFDMESIPFDSTTVVIVLKLQSEGVERTVGIVADAVSEVYNISNNDLRATPEMGEGARTRFVRALANVDDKLVILLDTEQLLEAGVLQGLVGTSH